MRYISNETARQLLLACESVLDSLNSLLPPELTEKFEPSKQKLREAMSAIQIDVSKGLTDNAALREKLRRYGYGSI